MPALSRAITTIEHACAVKEARRGRAIARAMRADTVVLRREIRARLATISEARAHVRASVSAWWAPARQLCGGAGSPEPEPEIRARIVRLIDAGRQCAACGATFAVGETEYESAMGATTLVRHIRACSCGRRRSSASRTLRT
jgi:hypothetical protein